MKKSLLWMGICLLCLTSAYAEKIRVSGPIDAPGIDDQGMCNLDLGGQITIKVVLNTTTGKFKAAGKGDVENQSNRTVKIVDAPEILTCFDTPFFLAPGETIDRAQYKVSKTGKARFSVKGRGQLP